MTDQSKSVLQVLLFALLKNIGHNLFSKRQKIVLEICSGIDTNFCLFLVEKRHASKKKKLGKIFLKNSAVWRSQRFYFRREVYLTEVYQANDELFNLRFSDNCSKH